MKSDRFNIRVVLLFVAACLFAIVPNVLAQDTSSLSGAVLDASGAVVPNAKITVHNTATGSERLTNTNESGNFTLSNMQPGSYTVRVESTGFQSVTLDNVNVDPSIGRRVEVSLRPGDVASTVTVEAGANTVQTESGSVGQLITQEQVKSIQLN